MPTGEITAAQISAVSTVLRLVIAPKDLADFTNQRKGGALVTEDTAITDAIAERGIAEFITWARLGATFNEKNPTHLNGAIKGSLYFFWYHMKGNMAIASDHLQAMKDLAGELRGMRRFTTVTSGRIENDTEERELGGSFKDTFRTRLEEDEDDT